MSVLIKGIKMPDNCFECPLKYDVDEGHYCYCRFTGAISSGVGRQVDCPLVNVPMPHGRLIDGDKLKSAFPLSYLGTPILIASVRARINHTPAIIEAEGDES